VVYGGIPSNALVVAATLGVSLIYGELCSLGRVMPGVTGSVLLLSASYLLARRHPASCGAMLLSMAILLFIFDAWRPKSALAFIAASAFLAAGLMRLIPGPERISWWVAALCALLLGAETSYLARIAARARDNKRCCPPRVRPTKQF
jgi:membrane-bound ClpP family serine protease